MPRTTAVRGWLLPASVVLACLAGAVLLTSGLDERPVQGQAVRAPDDASALGGARAPGALADLVPVPEERGYGWVADEAAASQQITDGPGLLRPCGATYPSDAQRVEVQRSNVVQAEYDVPRGMAMTFELARYDGDGAAAALRERSAALQACSSYTRTFAGYDGTDVQVALLPPPAGGSSAAAHLAVTAATSVGEQVVEYTYLVAQQGDVLLSAVVGNGNGAGSDLDAFAAGHFHQARLALAGLPAPSPEQAQSGAGAP